MRPLPRPQLRAPPTATATAPLPCPRVISHSYPLRNQPNLTASTELSRHRDATRSVCWCHTGTPRRPPSGDSDSDNAPAARSLQPELDPPAAPCRDALSSSFTAHPPATHASTRQPRRASASLCRFRPNRPPPARPRPRPRPLCFANSPCGSAVSSLSGPNGHLLPDPSSPRIASQRSRAHPLRLPAGPPNPRRPLPTTPPCTKSRLPLASLRRRPHSTWACRRRRPGLRRA